MKYKNAKNILPKELLEEIQEYTQGDFIYIPIVGDKKMPWGEKNGTKQAIYDRNENIFKLYQEGYSIHEIVKIYNLSESSIRKIISNIKKRSSQLGLGGLTNE